MGKTLQELRQNITAEELRLWHAYETIHGFPLSRVEAAVALSGSAQCHAWGVKVKATDLMPVYEAPKPLSYSVGAELFAAFAAAHNQRQASFPTTKAI